MKILIFGDNHGRIDNLLTVYEREKPDFTIHTGDYNDRDDNGKGTYIKDKYLKLFNKYIDGNNGCGLRAKNENDFLKNYLNDYQTFKLNNKFILLTHSWDNLDKEYPDIYRQRMGIIYDCKPDFIICGHTHTARIWSWNGIKIINPGSLEILPYHSNKEATYIIIEINGKKWEPRICHV